MVFRHGRAWVHTRACCAHMLGLSVAAALQPSPGASSLNESEASLSFTEDVQQDQQRTPPGSTTSRLCSCWPWRSIVAGACWGMLGAEHAWGPSIPRGMLHAGVSCSSPWQASLEGLILW